MEIDARKLTDKQASHLYLKEALSFPDHYGANLDAFYDCLTEKRGDLYITHTAEAGPYFRYIDRVLRDVEEECERIKLHRS